ncbi:MAG: Vacuolar morphogenesis protein 6 [Thelocarpon superellum]|nr:MAG: Vacuolar morphogenesis protein 6 [Thelocarpon superellum]
MLSAFTARPIVELKQRDKSKIESILAYGDRLLVGLNTGSLRIYRINDEPAPTQSGPLDSDGKGTGTDGQDEPSPPPSTAVDLLREVEKFSTKAIQQLAMVKEANLLISLSDSAVSIHDLQEYTLQEHLTRTKGATTFAVTSDIIKDASTGVPSIVTRLAVAVKRRLLIWSWQDTELSSDVTEITLASAAKFLTWARATTIICGLSAGYVMVEVEKAHVVDIVGPGSIGGASGSDTSRLGGVGAAGMGYMGMGSWGPKSLATRLTDGNLLLARDINTLFIDADGAPLPTRQIPWSTAPDALAFSYPFILALNSTAKGTVEVRNPETHTLLQTIPLLHATQIHVPPPNVSLAHAGKGFLVVSERCIWRMAATDYGAQVDELVALERFDEAISLLNLLEDALLDDKFGRLRMIQMRKARSLFDAQKYRDALDLFTDVAAPPETVIRLYPPSIAGDLSATAEARIPRPHTAASETASTASSRRTEGGAVSDAASVASPRLGAVSDRARLEGDDLLEAVGGLCSFLADHRRRLQRFLTPDGTLTGAATEQPAELAKFLDAPSPTANEDWAVVLPGVARLVDTTLFKAYMLARPGLAGSLFRIANFCDPDVVNRKLLETGRYGELVDFFHGKKLHRPALELLRRFGQGDGAGEAPPPLRGPRRTIAYLQAIPAAEIDLILEFAAWPLREDAEAGMQIFLADTENAETLPRDRVVAFLHGIDDTLAVTYLEHIIHELNDLTPAFHQRLVHLYLERLDWRNDGPDRHWPDFRSEAERTDWQERLLVFLRTSQQYSTAKALNLIPRDDPEFYEARALVLSKMGQHKQALEIYVFKLQDHEKAEEYCNQIHLAQETAAASSAVAPSSATRSSFEDDAPPSIYHTLLSLYLAPPPPHQPDWAPALHLLSKHGSRLPASSTLNLIPETLPIHDLESYFRGRIRAANSLVHQGRVVMGLQKVERIRTQATLLLGEGLPGESGARSRRVLITDERVCGVCHRRLGGSAISVMPE